MDILQTIKKQSAKQIEELKELSGKLSGKLKDVIGLIPEDTRHKSIEEFLNSIREGVLGKAPRKYAKRAKKTAASKRRGRPKGTKTTTRGRKKTTAASETPAAE
ncbi:MAG: hypothetical protein M0018_08260 [Nitrospiraceae bacterium]|nr:hypothetical protein [Nitrospiraceae bacterium]